ncbi:MAG: hypothetical protein K0U36_00080 [Alphaproteobacteria bacterium]|nr:hypothetical protein [Alphaproteobacteria bacterium]
MSSTNNDVLGGSGNDFLMGKEGNDLIIGGGGTDTVLFDDDISSYRVRWPTSDVSLLVPVAGGLQRITRCQQ